MPPELRISIDVFSGRPNLVIDLSGKKAKEALERLRPGQPLSKREAALPPSILGYRGLVIEQVGKRIKTLPKVFHVVDGQVRGGGRAYRMADPGFEDFICGTVPRSLGRRFPVFLRKEIARGMMTRARLVARKPGKWFLKHSCPCAPLYEPAWWNDGYSGVRQYHNNCYNYATNYRTDTFAQPGRAAGILINTYTCSVVRPAAVADDLIDSPSAPNRCPKEGHLVALVTGWVGSEEEQWPDYHWYRRGRNGYWSHKPGGGQATNVDNSGNLITDPRTADRGGYINFCTFMIVMHGHVKIK